MIRYPGHSYSDGPIRIEFGGDIFPGSGAKFHLGKFCSIASNLRVFLGGNHRTDWISTFAFPEYFGKGHAPGQPSSKGDVVIGNDVWIGDSVVIMSGIRIGHGAAIGAYSIVAKDIEPYIIAAGNPCRPIRPRLHFLLVNQLLKLKWWDWSDEDIIKIYPFLQSNNPEPLFEYARKRGLME